MSSWAILPTSARNGFPRTSLTCSRLSRRSTARLTCTSTSTNWGCACYRPGGRLSFVVTNKWLKAAYGEPLRRFFAEDAWVESVVDFGHAKQIFEDADVFPSIIVARKPTDDPAPAYAQRLRHPARTASCGGPLTPNRGGGGGGSPRPPRRFRLVAGAGCRAMIFSSSFNVLARR